ncbi:MAG: DNA translocase FtsK 4TM domain-containing protein [Candidatus Jidaibacter sp.]|jgi:S-DNA-T family DNA segregation ATPase FtsK/SpoIIIE|nr:DNA translocase FtsK 4TM domain-containing protein [Candidatus Jidaibacter sp.]
MIKRFVYNLWGLLLLGFGIFLSVALLSYNASDPSFHRVGEVEKISNWAGLWGAYIAGPLINGFGAGLIVPILFLCKLGFNMLLRHKSSIITLRLCAIIISIPAISLTMAIAAQHLNISKNIGGFIGAFMLGEIQLKISMLVVFAAAFITSVISSAIALSVGFMDILKAIINAVKVLIYTGRIVLWSLRFSYKLIRRTFSRNKMVDEEEEELEEAENKVPHSIEIVNKAKSSSSKAKIQSKLKLEPDEFELPPSSLLKDLVEKTKKFQLSESSLNQNSKLLQKVLSDFGIVGEITKIHPGPVVTLYEFEPTAGTKSSRVIGLSDDIARSMSAISARIAVIPGKSSLGIELPNSHREIVALRELLESKLYQDCDDKLPIILGKNIAGEPVIADLAKMPHLLVAGTTGSGKSVAINTMILSLLYMHPPSECRFIMIDPKMLELSVYDGIPHLLAPVVTEPKKAISALKWVVKEMENRYRLMSMLGVRNIDGYNKSIADAIKTGKKLEKQIQIGFDSATGQPKYETISIEQKHLPYIVVIVDEMADLMIVAGKEIEGSIQRLAQMARAAGIHIIMATQRPSVDVITGVIKANFPTRISFQVTSKIDSRTILGEQGAEQLLGMGDMLFMRGGGRVERVHGPFVSDAEVESVTKFLKDQGAPQYIENITVSEDDSEGAEMEFGSSGDDLYDQALAIVLKDRKASTSYVQRCLRIGYNRAANLIEKMEREGVVSAPNHVGKRDILIGEE